MDVKGKHDFEVEIGQLWNFLMDPVVLAKITPGISKLEALGDDKFKSISEIKLGPVKGSFKGQLKVTEKDEPNFFCINMEQLSQMGNAHVRVEMKLSKLTEQTSQLEFEGKAKLSGLIARTGQRVLSGVANVITKEVFAALEKHIIEHKEKDTTEQEQKDTTAQEQNEKTEQKQKDITGQEQIQDHNKIQNI